MDFTLQLPWRGLHSALGADLANAARGASILDPAGDNAAEVAKLWWFFFTVCTVVFVGVIAATAIAIWRTRSAASDTGSPLPQDMKRDRGLVVGVGTAVTLTVLALVMLLFRDVLTEFALRPPNAPDALTIKLTGHQWWWAAEYQDPLPSNVLEVANEFHVPVGRPIQLQLQSTDVIHSFWLPNITGKKDLVPGHPTSLWFNVDKPGTYYGQCAEFCGYQHANMRLIMVAESPEAYEAWKKAASAPAPEPASDKQRRGQEVFLTRTCVTCHTIQGTIAHSRVGPGLTHVASQHTLGAGAIPNTRDHLLNWIKNPQAIKPGARMPQNELPPDDLDALVEYLQSLK